MYIYLYIYMYTYTYICKYVNMYIHMYVFIDLREFLKSQLCIVTSYSNYSSDLTLENAASAAAVSSMVVHSGEETQDALSLKVILRKRAL